MARRGRPPGAPVGFTDRQYGADEELALAAQVARAYFIEDRSKVSIAESIGLSRFQVARLLQLARSTGIVRIEIASPGGIDRDLSALIQKKFGIRRALVVSSPTSVQVEDIGRTLAQLLKDSVVAGNVVGLSWSQALRSMVEQIHDVEPCRFVQLAGHITPEDESIGSVELVRRAAAAAGGESMPIYAPFLMPSSDAAAALLTQPEIARAVEQFDHLDLAMISIGGWAPTYSVMHDAMSEAERRSARELGVVGDINGRMFNAHGETVDWDMDKRTIAISFDQLRNTPEVICSSYGVARATATLSAIRAGFATTWVMDQTLARAVLALADQAPPRT